MTISSWTGFTIAGLIALFLIVAGKWKGAQSIVALVILMVLSAILPVVGAGLGAAILVWLILHHSNVISTPIGSVWSPIQSVLTGKTKGG